MAVDTRSKRASCLGLALAVTLTLPLADGTVGQADRQHVAYCYAGISASPAVIEGVTLNATAEAYAVSAVSSETFAVPSVSAETFEV